MTPKTTSTTACDPVVQAILPVRADHPVRDLPWIPVGLELRPAARHVQHREPDRRPGEDDERAFRVGEHAIDEMRHGPAAQRGADDRHDDGDRKGCRKSELEREHVDREEDRSDQLLPRRIPGRDDDRVPVPAQDVGQFLLGQLTAQHLGALLDFGGEVLRQLTDDVVLLPARQEEADGAKVTFDEGHRGNSRSNPLRAASRARHSSSSWPSITAPDGDNR